MSITYDAVEFEKVKPKTKKVVKVRKGKCDFFNRVKSHIFIEEMARGKIF